MFGYRLFSFFGYTNRGTPGQIGTWAGGLGTNVIQFVTISTLGNATDFGDLTVARSKLGSTSNGITDRGVYWGGFA